MKVLACVFASIFSSMALAAEADVDGSQKAEQVDSSTISTQSVDGGSVGGGAGQFISDGFDQDGLDSLFDSAFKILKVQGVVSSGGGPRKVLK